MIAFVKIAQRFVHLQFELFDESVVFDSTDATFVLIYWRLHLLEEFYLARRTSSAH
jgi:hypothetical protein